jgi:hypothetical protein
MVGIPEDLVFCTFSQFFVYHVTWNSSSASAFYVYLANIVPAAATPGISEGTDRHDDQSDDA